MSPPKSISAMWVSLSSCSCSRGSARPCLTVASPFRPGRASALGGVRSPHGGLLGRHDGGGFAPRRDAVLGLGCRVSVFVQLGPVRVVELVQREARVEAVVEAL